MRAALKGVALMNVNIKWETPTNKRRMSGYYLFLVALVLTLAIFVSPCRVGEWVLGHLNSRMKGDHVEFTGRMSRWIVGLSVLFLINILIFLVGDILIKRYFLD